MDIKFECKAPAGETPKAYKVWNGRSFSYLAKSHMENVTITGDTMTFFSDSWFQGIHTWLTVVGKKEEV